MKLDDETGCVGAAGSSLLASAEAARRSDGEETRPLGRVPGSSGWSGGRSGASAARDGVLGARISLIAIGGAGGRGGGVGANAKAASAACAGSAAWKSRGAAA